MMEQKIESLKRALKESKYTVALCGSGILEEEGYMMLKKPERAYDIETRYGVSPEYIFSLVDMGITPHTPKQNRTCAINAYGFSLYIFILYL